MVTKQEYYDDLQLEFETRGHNLMLEQRLTTLKTKVGTIKIGSVVEIDREFQLKVDSLTDDVKHGEPGGGGVVTVSGTKNQKKGDEKWFYASQVTWIVKP